MTVKEYTSSTLFGLLLAALLVWVAVSILIAIIRINKTYVLTPNRFLYPANFKPEDCKDIAGLIAFLTPRFVIFCVLCLLLAAFLLLMELTTIFDWLPGWLHNASSLFFFLPLFVWYIVFINKAAKRFW